MAQQQTEYNNTITTVNYDTLSDGDWFYYNNGFWKKVGAFTNQGGNKNSIAFSGDEAELISDSEQVIKVTSISITGE